MIQQQEHLVLNWNAQLMSYNLNYNNMLNLSADDTLDLLKDFLPDIEQQLRNQLEPDLEEQYQTRMQAELQKIERQAQQQFQEALATLEQQFQQLKAEKEHELQKQLQKQQASFEEKEKARLAQAQEKFLQEHFDDRIMAHPAMAEVEEALEAEVAEVLLAKYSAARDKRMKELRVRLQSREQKERVEADKVIRSDIYAKSGLQELRDDLHKYKIAVAAQKSQYNVRISKVAAEVKALEKKSKDIEYGNSDLLINQMEQQINQLQRQFTLNQCSHQTSNLQDSQIQQITVDFGGNFSKNKHFGINNNKLNGSLGDAQYIGEDIELDSDQDSLDQSNSRQLPSLPPPPMSYGEAFSRLMQEPSRYQSEPQELVLQMPSRPVLQWDVGRMLREQWEEDSFDRYLSQRNDKENCSNNANQNQDSNFQSLYTEHLKKLNRDSRVPKMRKLSERAKQQVLAHYGSHRHPREEYY